MRYRFYRVHKYVCFELSEFDRLAAKTDFLNSEACQILKEKGSQLFQMLKHHAEYEDTHIHELLRKKNSLVHHIIENDHLEHEAGLHNLFQQIENIMASQDPSEKILLGMEFCLSYRLFHSTMLKHLYDEEKILLPELQSLYTDQELASLQAKTYQNMTPQQMLGMLNVLFPHANEEDMRFFTNEMKIAEPEKFKLVWEELSQHYKQLINNRCSLAKN